MLEADGFAPAVVSAPAGGVVARSTPVAWNAFEMQEKAVALDEAQDPRPAAVVRRPGAGPEAEDYVNEQVRRKPLEQMAKPFVVVATRLEDGERTVLHAATRARPCA